MKLVELHLATLFLLAASVSELSAQSSSSATQTVTFGVRRLMPTLLASNQRTASSTNDSHGIQSKTLKMAIGSGMNSKQIASDVQTSNILSGSSLAPLKAPKSRSNKLVITVTE